MRAILRNLVVALFGAVLSLGANAQFADLRYDYGREAPSQCECAAALQQVVLKGSGGASTVTAAAFPLLAPDGGTSNPSYSFASAPTTGWFLGSTQMQLSSAGATAGVLSSASWVIPAIKLDVANQDVVLVRDAAQTLAQKNGTNAQVNRLYFSTTGPVYWMATARTAGVLYTGTGGAAQVSYAQTTVPTCITNCGTSPSIVGTDTAMRVTMGASGVPASAWVVQFNGTWPAAPVCHVTAALATMVVGKIAIAVVTTTTTLTVTTNGTAPATSDQYQIICLGVS